MSVTVTGDGRITGEENHMDKFKEKYFHERNYGCRIREFIYRGLRTLTMENELIKVSILADKGTDIFEFVYKPKDIDFMWHSFNGVRNPANFVPTREHPGGAFLDFYEGGWQEMFPNISDPCDYMGAPLGIHGEVCLPPWEYRIATDLPEQVEVKFWIRTARTPYYLEKRLRINSGDPTLYIDEKVINEGCENLQFMWGHHPAVGPLFLDESCIIEMPSCSKARTIDADLGKGAVLPRNMDFEWPLAKAINGDEWDLSKVPAPESQVLHQFYLYDINEGRYTISNVNKGLGFGMKWDKEMFPVIWVWAPYGGAMGYPWYGRNYNLAIEPWSSVPGNLGVVAEKNTGVQIKPGQEIAASLQAFAFENNKGI